MAQISFDGEYSRNQDLDEASQYFTHMTANYPKLLTKKEEQVHGAEKTRTRKELELIIAGTTQIHSEIQDHLIKLIEKYNSEEDGNRKKNTPLLQELVEKREKLHNDIKRYKSEHI